MDKWQRQAQERNRRTERTVAIIMVLVILIIGGIAIAHMNDAPNEDPPALENVPGGP